VAPSAHGGKQAPANLPQTLNFPALAGEAQGAEGLELRELGLEALEAVDASSVLAIVGCDDSYTPPDDVDGLEATGVTVVRYPGADHGFVHDPTRPAHRAEDAADAWSRVIAWLRG